MTRLPILTIISLLFLLELVSNCSAPSSGNYLLRFTDADENDGYRTPQGEVIIPPGKYLHCFTDTFSTYAIVLDPTLGFIGIDREEKVMYQVFPFDNGPDYPSDGLFRILKDKKIGYADEASGQIIIAPQFDCAYPFENGKAQVSTDCQVQTEGEHSSWTSDHWYSIDKKGGKVE